MAREHAIQHVQGNYVAFCDSDDWVDEDWLISMYATLKTHDADIVSYRAKIPGRNIIFNPDEHLSWDRDTAIQEFLIHKRLNGVLWTNLFKAELFAGIHFNPHLTCYEDGDVMWRILQKVSKVVKVNDAKYNWVVSGSSLSNGSTNEKQLSSALIFLDNVMADAQNMGQRHKQQAEKFYKGWAYSGIKKMFRGNLQCPDIESKMLKILRHKPIHSLRTQTTFLDKLFLSILMIMPSLARMLFRKYLS